MSIKVELKLTRLRRALQGSPQAIDRGAKAYAEAVGDLAQQLAPVDTGELRESKEIEPGDRTGAYRVVFRAKHAAPVEFGTYKMSAQPFLTPALRNVDPLPFFSREIREMIR